MNFKNRTSAAIIAATVGVLALLAGVVHAAPLQQVDLNSGLVAFWNLNETSGNRSDASGGGHTLTDNNTVGYAAGKISNAADFVGTNTEYLSASSSLAGSSWTVAGWTYVSNSAPFGYLASEWTGTGNQRSFTLGSNGKFSYSTNGLTTYTVDNVWSYDTWHFFAVTYDSGTIKITHDNITNSYSDTIYDGTANFTLGALSNSTSPATGKIDAVGVWNRALNASEITLLYNLGAGTEYPFVSPTSTPTNTPTATATFTPTATPTSTPTATPTTVGNYTVDFSGGPNGWIGTTNGIQTTPAYHTTSGAHSGACAGLGPGYWQSTEPELTNPTLGEWYNHSAIISTHKLSFDTVTVYHGGLPDSTVHFAYLYTSDDGNSWDYIGQNFSYDSCGTETIGPVANKYVKIVYSHRYNGSSVSAAIYKLYFTTYVDHGGPEPTPTPQTCDAPPNNDFLTSAGWQLANTAAITGGILELGLGDSATQNVALSANTAYSTTVVSVPITDTLAFPALTISLGSETHTITSTTGVYTTTLTPPVDTPQALTLANSGDPGSLLRIDSICMMVATGQRICFAPENGDFSSIVNSGSRVSGTIARPAGWEFHNGAGFDRINEWVTLPYNETDKALVNTTSTYTMPTIGASEYLLLSFTALANGAAFVGGQVGAASFDYEVYEAEYEYQTDISTQAGQPGVSFAFANIGSDGFTSDGEIYVDNVCVWVSTTPATLAAPASNRLKPITFGWNIAGCSDIPAILAGLGINVYVLEEIYAAGVSVWDPNGWVPWLAAALWVNAIKPLMCGIVTMFSWLVGMLEYILNSGLNFLDWIIRSGRAISTQLPGYVSFATVSWRSFGLWLTTTGGNWITWFADSFKAFGAALPDFGELIKANGWNLAVLIWNMGGSILLLLLAAMGGPFLYTIILIWNGIAAFFNFVAAALGYDTVKAVVSVAISASLKAIGYQYEWFFTYIKTFTDIPVMFFNALMDGANADSFGLLIGCAGNGTFWCNFLAGLDLVNGVGGHTIFYPIVITAIVIGTIYVFKNNVMAIWEWLTEDILRI